MKKAVVILLHTGYWAAYLLLLAIFYGLMNMDRSHRIMPGWWFWIVMVGFAILPGALGFYAAYLKLFQKYFVRKRIRQLVVAILFLSIVAAIIGELSLYLSLPPHQMNRDLETTITMGGCIAFNALLNAVMGLVLKGFITGYDDIYLKEELARKNTEMELALLKSRINPHFLFNTINNIDVLIQQDANRASDYLNKLSHLMRFMLYETKSERIPLSKELSYIEEYMELQKIRTSNPDYADYIVVGSSDNWFIAPMVFIPFIENAFKHAEDKRTANAIAIRITIESDKISFDCRNIFGKTISIEPKEQGIGNGLIQKRLTLLYPNSHSLETTVNGNTYHVKLIIRHDAY